MVDLFYIVGENKLYSRQRLYIAVGNSVDKVKCHFDFKSSEWLLFTAKVAVFKSASFNITKVVPIAVDNTCIVPWEITCKPGVVLCYLVGSSDTDKLITEPVQVMLNTGIAKDDYDYSDEPTPSEYAQFVEDIKAAMDEYYLSREYSYEMLKDLPSIEGAELIGAMDMGSFGFELASVADIDNMFD